MTEANEIQKGKFRFASGKRFIESMRHQGLTEIESIKELIDNSLDAFADNVWIEIWEDNKKINIMVQDDGRGMSRELLERAPAFGESDNEFESTTIGKFGFGMPTAITARKRSLNDSALPCGKICSKMQSVLTAGLR